MKIKPYPINKVMLSGVIGTKPQLQKLSNNTNLCYFSLSVPEKWTSSDGQPMERNNWFKIEVLGKNAEAVFNTVKKNEICFVDGYLRQENFGEKCSEAKSIVKVRAYSVNGLVVLLEEGDQLPQVEVPNDKLTEIGEGTFSV